MRSVANQRFMYDVAADGERFLVATPLEETSSATPPITLLVNWPAVLKH
jgi:hypothetical protein